MLKVDDLSVNIETDTDTIYAVDHVSLEIKAGETVGIVGESGSGKSVLANTFMRLNDEDYFSYPNGRVLFGETDILQMSDKSLRQLRGKDIAMIFQDPMSSLNPVLKIGKQITEAIRTHQSLSKTEAKEKAKKLLSDVGIADIDRRFNEYPHQFSGGMRQRILIAMALASEPKLLIADEPTTALDVTIQAQILNLLKEIQAKYNTAILIITHDLGVVANVADRIYVMYAGEVLESGLPEDIFYQTRMPYTWSLLKSIPNIKDRQRLFQMTGQTITRTEELSGCPFYERCLFRKPICQEVKPGLSALNDHHEVACHLSSAEFIEKSNQINRELLKET